MKKDAIKAIEDSVIKTEGRRKLSCFQAFKICEEFKMSLKEIGAYCDENEIKVFDCQLGCF